MKGTRFFTLGTSGKKMYAHVMEGGKTRKQEGMWYDVQVQLLVTPNSDLTGLG